MNNFKQSNWISSSGGAFIILPKTQASTWDSNEDYESTFGLYDFINIISCHGIETLAFGDTPMDVSVFSNENEVILVRWVYANDAAQIYGYMNEVDFNKQKPIENICLNFSDNELVLFDAAYDYLESDYLNFSVRTKENEVLTYTLAFSDDCKVVAHRFVGT